MQNHRTLSFRAANFAALFSLALIVFLVSGFAAAEVALAGGQMSREVLTIESGEASHTFNIEVARSPGEKAHGLMYRTALPVGTGMLFPYEEATELQMWMRNTYISLDMVFIRADGRIHRIEARTEPMSEKIIPSNGNVTAVLEIGAGEAGSLGLKPGDLVRHGHFGTGE